MAYATARKGRTKSEPKRRPADVVLRELMDWADSLNVAEDIEEDRLAKIGTRVVKEFEIDDNSRDEWREKAKKSLERAKLKRQPKSYPWDGAANVRYPLLTTAALQFASRAYPAIIDGQRVVKAQIIGDDETGEKRSKADRISQHMSYQLVNEMPEWEEDTDTLLHQLPIVGCCFRKVWYDSTLERNRSEMVSAIDLVVNQKTRSLETVPRISQCFTLYPHEIEERMDSGAFIECDDIELNNSGADGDEDAPHDFIEQHRWLDLNDDGHREPWIVTVHKETEKVVRIVANYDPSKIKLNDEGKLARIARYNTFVKYPFFRDPDGGFYDLGLGELLESMSEVIDSTLNMMLDSGNLQNAGGGFIGSGVRLKKNQMRFQPGQYHVVDAQGSKIREAIYNMEHPGPSPVLFQLLGMMIDTAKEVANIKDVLSGDSQRNAPATTTLALIEQGMKVYTSIYKRIHRALKKEYGLLFDLNNKFLPEEHYFVVLDDRKAVKKSDYEVGAMDIVPVSDPNIVTDMQKMSRAQIYMEVAGSPAFQAAGGNAREAMMRFFEAMGTEDIEKLLPEKPQGPNPVEEMQARGATANVEEAEAKAEKGKADAVKSKAEAETATATAAIVKDDTMQELKAREANRFQSELEEQFNALGIANGELEQEERGMLV